MISVIIPYWESTPEKKAVLSRCTKSLVGHDEIIIVWNNRMGYAPAINRGLMSARGDFLIVMNDDVVLRSGNLADLCIPDVVTSPLNGDRSYPYIWGSCFCLPRRIYNRLGGLDERYETSYFDDDDLILTLQTMGVPMRTVDSVVFDHPHPGTTLDSLPDRNEFFERNKKRFLEKWGRL